MEKLNQIKFANKTALFYPDKKQLLISNNSIYYLALSNGIAFIGILPLFTFIGKSWNEISGIHLLLILFIFGIAGLISIRYHRSAKNKNALVFDGITHHILKGKEGISFDIIKGLGIQRHIQYDEFDNYTYSFELLLQLKNGNHFSIMKDASKKDIVLLKSWIKKIIQAT